MILIQKDIKGRITNSEAYFETYLKLCCSFISRFSSGVLFSINSEIFWYGDVLIFCHLQNYDGTVLVSCPSCNKTKQFHKKDLKNSIAVTPSQRHIQNPVKYLRRILIFFFENSSRLNENAILKIFIIK